MFRTVTLALAMSGPCPCSSVRADDAEDKAVAFVEKLGGRVTRDEKAPGKPVVAIDLQITAMTDAGLKELTALYLSGTQVTDAGLKELALFKNLTMLKLVRADVTDAGVKELQKALPNCKIVK